MSKYTIHYQPSEQGELSSESYRWMLRDGFLEAINQHRRERVIPSHLLCADESISRWYSVGGSYLNVGLPFYAAIDCDPEYGCEIQNLAC